MASEKQIQLMSSAPVPQAILKMSLPVICGMMVQVLYNLVDTFFIGQLNDPNQLAAANITTPVFMLMMAIASVVGTGAASFISRCLGAKDNKTADKTLSTGIALCTLMGIVVMILGLVFLSPIVRLFGASEAVAPFAEDYSRVMFIGAVAVMLNYAVGQLIRSEGAIMPSMFGMLIGTVVNIGLDPLFIFTFNMGIGGAAIATVIGQAAGLVYYITFYARKKSIVGFNIKNISKDSKIYKETIFIGIPAAMSQLLISVAMIVCNNLAAEYGETVVAGLGVAAKLMYIGTFIFMGFSAGCQPLTGFNYGARNFNRVKSIIRWAMLITEIVGIALAVVFGFLAPNLISGFTAIPEVIAAGAVVLGFYKWTFVVLGPQMLCSTTIQAFGAPKSSLILSIARQIFFYIPLMFLFNNMFGFNGLMCAQPVSDALTLVLGLILLNAVLKKAMKQDR